MLHSDRRRRVTLEPLAVTQALLGLPLSSVRRRAAALSADLFLVFLYSLVLLPAGILFTLQWQEPRLLPRLGELLEQDQDPWEDTEFLYYLMRMATRHYPACLSPELRELVVAEDLQGLEQVLGKYHIQGTISFGEVYNEPYVPDSRQVVLTLSSVAGEDSKVLNFLLVLVPYFTLFAWWGKGKTPGKLLFGIRVVRLTGGPFRLRDSFNRAGGYTASLSTFGLGFLEAVRDPNRQALHDRIAGTVVIRAGRKMYREFPPAGAAEAAQGVSNGED